MWDFEDEPNPTKVVCGKSTSKQMVAYVVMYRLFHLNNVARSILSGTPQFLWRNSKNEQEKTNHYQISAFLTGQNIELMGQPRHSPNLAPNDFFLLFSPKNNFCYKKFFNRDAIVERQGQQTTPYFMPLF